MSAPLRLGLIGCGRIAELGYLPALAARDEVDLVAVADPVAERRRRLAEATGARAHAGVEELIGAGEVEAVIVASPASEHPAHARLVAEAGLACLVEKPPATDSGLARELAELDPAPWIGFNRRFRQGLEPAGLIPPQGPLELELELRYRRASWRAHAVRDDALLDLGPHLVDLALLFGGGPARVRSATSAPERAELELELARGTARIRCATDRRHLERVIVRRPGGPRLAASTTGGAARGALARLRRGPHPLAASLALQLAAFARAARGGDPGPLATAEQGARVMAVIGEAADAAAAGAPPAAGAREPVA